MLAFGGLPGQGQEVVAVLGREGLDGARGEPSLQPEKLGKIEIFLVVPGNLQRLVQGRMGIRIAPIIDLRLGQDPEQKGDLDLLLGAQQEIDVLGDRLDHAIIITGDAIGPAANDEAASQIDLLAMTSGVLDQLRRALVNLGDGADALIDIAAIVQRRC